MWLSQDLPKRGTKNLTRFWNSFPNSGNNAMKKLLVFSLVLFLIGPAIGWACECCPTIETAPTSLPILSAHHDCCPMLDVRGERCGIKRTESPLLVSQRILIPQVSSPGIPLQISEFSKPIFTGSPVGLPFVFSETPLYLTHRVLRI